MGVATCGELGCALRGYTQLLSTRAWSLRGCERCGEVGLMRSEEDEGKAVSTSPGLLSGSIGERGWVWARSLCKLVQERGEASWTTTTTSRALGSSSLGSALARTHTLWSRAGSRWTPASSSLPHGRS